MNEFNNHYKVPPLQSLKMNVEDNPAACLAGILLCHAGIGAVFLGGGQVLGNQGSAHCINLPLRAQESCLKGVYIYWMANDELDPCLC